MTAGPRIFVKITRDTLPKVRDKFPFLYLEHGRVVVDDSSIKWIDSDNNLVRIPVATISCLILGPGTSVTHEAVKVCAASNCMLCWAGEDSLLFYAFGDTPTADTKQFRLQMELAANPQKRLAVAVNMLRERFPEADLDGRSLSELRGRGYGGKES